MQYGEMLIQILLSLLLGGLIGLDRELKRKPGGLRTHILICLGSTFLMIISQHASGKLGDPSRIAAQVISGVGFIGGGVIMRYGFNIKGITTAATIWIVTAIGLGVGLKLYWESVITTFFAWLVLFFVHRFEHRFFAGDEYKILVIDLKNVRIENEEIQNLLHRFDLRSKTLEVEKMLTKNRTRYKFLVNIPRNVELDRVIKELTRLKRIQKIVVEDRD